MKIKKRVTIIADVLVDEDFDCNGFLRICEDITEQVPLDSPSIYVGRSDQFEVIDYIYQDEVEIVE